MTPVDQRVYEETLNFEKALPELLRGHEGEWVVFCGGMAHSYHRDFDAAYTAGLAAFGRDGGQVVAQVLPRGTLGLSRAAHRIFRT